MENAPRFPSFLGMFSADTVDRIPMYLRLLKFRALPHGSEAVRAVCAALQKSPEPESEVLALLAEDNWRPHLVGATCVAFELASQATLDALWRAADRGSWVSPQLAAVAHVKDPGFKERAKLRMDAGCPLISSALESMSPVARHSQAGPAGVQERSAKLFSALLSLLDTSPAPPEWLETLKQRPDVQELLARDVDHGGGIAVKWRSELIQAIERRETRDER
jgi:hypothetical protein